MSPREPRWDRDFDLGKLGEARTAEMAARRGETKTDQRAIETGNLFIEIACKRQGEWKESGIHETEADYWWFLIGGEGEEPGQVAIVVPIGLLRELVQGLPVIDMPRGSHPTKGYLLPLRDVIGHPLALPSVPERTSPAPHGKRQVVKVRSTKFKPSELDAWLQEKGR